MLMVFEQAIEDQLTSHDQLNMLRIYKLKQGKHFAVPSATKQSKQLVYSQ